MGAARGAGTRDPETGALWLRTVVLSVVVVGAGTLAHLSGGGLAPDLLTTLLLGGVVGSAAFVVLSGPGATTLTGRTAAVVAFAVSGQTLVHLALTALRGMPAMSGMPSALHDRGPDPLANLVAELGPGHAPMLLAHLAAAVVVGLWLAVGDHVLTALLAALSWVGVRVSAVRLPVLRPLRVVVAEVLLRPLDAHLRDVVVLRGPPAHLL